MTILQAKTRQGKSTELIRRFITDKKPATLVTDELTLSDIHEIINRLKQDGHDINSSEMKNIETMQFTNCDADYYGMIQGRFTESLYLDIHMSKSALEDIKRYCKELEREYDYTITIVEQLSVSSDVEGVNVVVETL